MFSFIEFVHEFGGDGVFGGDGDDFFDGKGDGFGGEVVGSKEAFDSADFGFGNDGGRVFSDGAEFPAGFNFADFEAEFVGFVFDRYGEVDDFAAKFTKEA